MKTLSIVRPLACLALSFGLALPAAALELELGLGLKIDIAPYGIENVTMLAFAAPWIGSREGLQAGSVIAASIGPSKADFELSACLRVWPLAESVAVLGGAGLLAELYRSVPGLVPYLIGGLQAERGGLGLASCAELHIKSDDTDAMLWLAAFGRPY